MSPSPFNHPRTTFPIGFVIWVGNSVSQTERQHRSKRKVEMKLVRRTRGVPVCEPQPWSVPRTIQNARAKLPGNGLCISSLPNNPLGGIRHRRGSDVQCTSGNQRTCVYETRDVCESKKSERRERMHVYWLEFEILWVLRVLRENGGLGDS